MHDVLDHPHTEFDLYDPTRGPSSSSLLAENAALLQETRRARIGLEATIREADRKVQRGLARIRRKTLRAV